VARSIPFRRGNTSALPEILTVSVACKRILPDLPPLKLRDEISAPSVTVRDLPLILILPALPNAVLLLLASGNPTPVET
jgi:hypothetical protein